MTLIPIGSPDERTAILRLWDQRQDTSTIGKLINRQEYYVEQQLHVALDLRRGMKSLSKKKKARK